MRILVVDDDPTTLQIVEHTLLAAAQEDVRARPVLGMKGDRAPVGVPTTALWYICRAT